ncbi:hypothetical protein [Scytonema sp. PCC 10023]|uniref:hypothetical protein n=1 Tax=Scytonema sp. PCC 10023 TaxID=1680591 RepID=UPI0039C5B3E5
MPLTRKKPQSKNNSLTLPEGTELVGLVFDVVPVGNPTLFPEYAMAQSARFTAIALHAWFLEMPYETVKTYVKLARKALASSP